MRSNWVMALLASVCIVSISGCGSDESSSSPTSPSAPVLSLAGTWTGSFSIPGESECCRINSWTATQTGASVTGPMRIDVGEGQIVSATLAGTVSGAQLTSATFTVAAGGIPDPSLGTWAFSGTGTMAATTSSTSGPMAMTFPPACVGEDRVSNTPTATWTFSLTK